MKRIPFTLLCAVVAVCLLSIVWAADPGRYWRVTNTPTQFTADLGVGASSMLVLDQANVALTSPTVTFSALGKTYVQLSTNVNQAGIRPIYGTPGQVLILKAHGSGTNTLAFSDLGTSMSLGGTVTLTEGNNSCMALLCTTATLPVTGTGKNTSKWALLWSSAN